MSGFKFMPDKFAKSKLDEMLAKTMSKSEIVQMIDLFKRYTQSKIDDLQERASMENSKCEFNIRMKEISILETRSERVVNALKKKLRKLGK